MASLPQCMSGFVLFGIKAMPHNKNTFIERYSFNWFVFLDSTESQLSHDMFGKWSKPSQNDFCQETDKNVKLLLFRSPLDSKTKFFYGMTTPPEQTLPHLFTCMVTRWVCESIAQREAQCVLCQSESTTITVIDLDFFCTFQNFHTK
jgi:hypothetical protein